MENHAPNDITSSPLFDNLRKLISTIDELRDIGLQKYISLPRIAVLGTQSSGKSSLLESIVGLDFLPRGDGVVTRRPLELRLVRVQGEADLQPWAVFDAVKGKKFTNFDEVRGQIDKLTDEAAGQNKGIVDDPIVLTVFSPTCPDLTVIDLPGVTRIPIGAQPKNIEEITKNMVIKYCKDPRTIILCVIPANADLSTSDALKMAGELDPHGIRTIGVITKIDIMDKGTNAKKMLLGQDIPLKLGYVGVKNRSQQDIKDKMRVKKALEIEHDYFANHEDYGRLPPGYCGTEALVGKMTKIMYEHIRTLLPEIIREINNKASECEDKLRDLGPALPVSQREKTQLIWNMINQFTEQFKNKIRGKYEGKSAHPVKKEKASKDDPNKDMSVAAKIKLMFTTLYKDYQDDKDNKEYKVSKHYTDAYIQETLRAHEGDSMPGFPGIDAFLALLQPKLLELRNPCGELVQQVYSYLENIAIQLVAKTFQRFPIVLDEITEIVCHVLANERDRTKKIVDSIQEAECGYLFTNDEDYLTNRTTLMPQVQQQPAQAAGAGGVNKPAPPPAPVDPQKLFIQEMRNRLDAYFNIVVRNLRDAVPKAIGHFLVKNSQENLQFALFDEINKSQNIMESLGEPAHITQERELTTKMLEVLQKAARHLKKDPDLAAPIKVPEKIDDMKASGSTKTPSSSTKKGGWF